MHATLTVSICLLIGAAACGGGHTGPGEGQTAPGAEQTTGTTLLETGASAIQEKAPVDQIALYLVGFHPSKADPALQMESHHYCDQVNENFAQCVLYDGNTADSRLHGVEFIISEELYNSLPAEEQPYWHPHNYEILSGQLRVPGLPDVAEAETLQRKMNSYGKTWHFWQTGVFKGENDTLPLGPPHLAWSFNHDGEVCRDWSRPATGVWVWIPQKHDRSVRTGRLRPGHRPVSTRSRNSSPTPRVHPTAWRIPATRPRLAFPWSR